MQLLLRGSRDRNWAREEDGATAVEYGLMIALIALVIIGAVIAFGTNVEALFSDAAECVADLSDAADGC